MHKPDWIGVDWGTSNLRVIAVDKQGRVLNELSSQRGMGALEPKDFEPALLELIDPWLDDDHQTPVLACGMVGARQGWCETTYRSVPCYPVSCEGLTEVSTSDPRILVRILPGLSQADPADVMRGEETQIAGLLAKNPNFTGPVCLPGTHSKWANVAHGQVNSFQTFMTGELYSLISQHSVLRHDLSNGALDMEVFKDAALEAVENPLQVAKCLFGIRASSLLSGQEAHQASATLSGLLIGQELALTRDLWDGNEVAIIGASEIAELYFDMLESLGANVEFVTASAATLSGLKLATGLAMN